MILTLNCTDFSQSITKECLLNVKMMSESYFWGTYYKRIKEGNLEAARRLLKARCYWYPAKFAKIYLTHYVPAEYARHHYDLFEALPHGALGKKVNILAPRGSAKSTLMAVIFPIYRICYTEYDEIMESEGYRRERFILILSKSYLMAESRIKSIQSELENNEILRNHFGDLTSTNWGVKSLETHNGVRIRAIGRGGQIRGSLYKNYRPTLIISDDLDDPEKLLNPEVRKKDQDWFDTDFLRAGALDGSYQLCEYRHDQARGGNRIDLTQSSGVDNEAL